MSDLTREFVQRLVDYGCTRGTMSHDLATALLAAWDEVDYERGKNDDSLAVVARLDAALCTERKVSAWLAEALCEQFPCDGKDSPNLDPAAWLAAARKAVTP